MKPIEPPETFKVYQLVRMTGISFSTSTGSSSSPSIGVGFYTTLAEAEHNRTLEILKDTTPAGPNKPTWHVFELEFPNPVLPK